MTSLLLLVLVVQSPTQTAKADAPKGEAKGTTDVPKTLVPDAYYTPKVGDTVSLYNRSRQGALINVAVGKTGPLIYEIEKAVEARDPIGIEKLSKEKLAASLPSGTQVRVLGEEGETMQRVPGTTATRITGFTFYRVRILDGPMKDEEMIVQRPYVQRCSLVSAGKRKGSAKKGSAR